MERPGLDIDTVRSAVGRRWARIDVVAETESTNADLLAASGAPDRSVLAAEYQSGGRGRLDRSWVSPPRAGLTFSVLLRPEPPIVTWGWLPLLAGVALYEAVGGAGAQTVLKWPNDLLCRTDECKLAGILAQTTGEAVVLGIGLNVSATADELPADAATSLARCGAATLDRTALLSAVLLRLDARVAQWADVGGDAEACGLAAAYRSACATVGRPVAVTTTGGTTLTGTALGLDAAGRLQVSTSDGVQTVGAGDVQHLRPSG
jgi:BirA family biotin operon repressor/biotin-[acetyl-CoA-carboxylase] ligase